MSDSDRHSDDDALLADLGDALRSDEDNKPPPPNFPGYEVEGEISRGGQGVVYLAYHPKTKRRVAIKTLLTRTVEGAKQLARFEREVELVAALRHPGIVTLYDSGVTEEVVPYLVMEYIEGERIDRALRPALESGNRNRIVEAVALVCDAIGAAHQRGIIHRDLKPSNVLFDTDGRPRVVDFGLARETETPTAADGVTLEGEFVGTLVYSTPEQVSGGEHLVDVRTDVYALGLLAYQLLLGRLPYDIGGSLAELVDAISHQEPVRPRKLDQAISADLEAVVLKSLSKSQESRYPSAQAFGDDLRAAISGLPVNARRHDRRYLLRKTLWRHRYAVATASFIVLLIAASAIATGVLYYRAERARQLELAAKESEISLSEAWVTSVSAVNRETSDANISTVDELLDEMSLIIEEQLAGQPERLAEVRAALGRAYLGQNETAKARARLEASLSLLHEIPEVSDQELAEAEHALATAVFDDGDYAEAERLRRSALDRYLSSVGSDSPQVAEARLLLGVSLLESRQLAAARAEFEASLELRRRLFGDDSEEVANSLNSLARCAAAEGNDEEAATLAAEAVERLERALEGNDNWRLARVLTNAARYIVDRPSAPDEAAETVHGRYDEAERLLGRAMEITRLWEGSQGRDIAGTLRALVRLQIQRGQLLRRFREDPTEAFSKGLEYGTQLVEAMERVSGELHPDVAEAYSERGAVGMTSERYDEAERDFRKALEIYNKLYPSNHQLVGWGEALVGAVLTRQGDYDEAERLLVSGRDKVIAALGPDHPRSQTVIARVEHAARWRAYYEPLGRPNDGAALPPVPGR
ncbi:MAG: serine/threonine-protein kinase [Planctomycetota bacterium]